MLLALGGHLLPPSVGPHAGLRPGWSGAPSHSAPTLPNLLPSNLLLVSAELVPTLFYRTQGRLLLIYFLYFFRRGAKLLLLSAGFLLTGDNLVKRESCLFYFTFIRPLACFSFYLHFTRSVYVSLMLAISLERFQFERQ